MVGPAPERTHSELFNLIVRARQTARDLEKATTDDEREVAEEADELAVSSLVWWIIEHP
jgi:hypothetical protein